jgi:amino acid transporter
MTTTEVAPASSTGSGHKGLKDNAIGLLSNTVVAIASVAPAYSLAAALGFVVVAVGFQAPAVMLLAFIPMLFVATAYQQLNKPMPDCGTTFTWGTKAFGPTLGWMGGWGIIAADVIVMANLAQIAGQYMFQLVGAYGLAGSKWWTLLAGCLWMVAMGVICYIGIEISARVQYALLGIGLVMLMVFSITALVKVYNGSAPPGSTHVSASWYNPFAVSSFAALSAGLLTAIFIYWGWDTAVSINEETRDRERAPGTAALISTVVLLVTYVLVSTAAQAFAGIGDKGLGLSNTDNSGDVLSVLGSAVFGAHGIGHAAAKLLVLMVLSSAAASTLTTILPTARTSLSMAAYRAIPARFARIHRRYLTPTWSTVGMVLASLGFYILLTVVSTNVLADTISAIGLMIAFYYGLTGLACVWWFRHDLRKSGREFVVKGLMPFLGGAILLAFFVYGAYEDWKASQGSSFWTMQFSPHWQIGGIFLTGIGALVLGVVLMLIYRFVNPPFFKGRTLNKDTPILVPEDEVGPVKIAQIVGGDA